MSNPGQSVAAFDPQSVKRDFPALARHDLHYLDNAATAQMPNPVLAACHHIDVTARANVYGGQHRLARAALSMYEHARFEVAQFLRVRTPEEIVFTSGTTGSINLLAHSFGALLQDGDEILLSALEHHSNLLPWRQLAARRGVVLRVLPMTEEGRIDQSKIANVLTRRLKLVALTHCSNVTGAITDVAPIVAAARSVGARIMLDGAQYAPHGPIDIPALGIDFYAFSGHKCYGPTGTGVLWGRSELLREMPPFLTGGQMISAVTSEGATYREPPRRFEAGTPNFGGAVGLGAAVAWMGRIDWPAARAHERRLADRILDHMNRLPGVRVLGPLDTENRRGVVSFTVEGMTGDEVCSALDRRGVAMRGGYHCAQPAVEALGAIGGAARASLAPYNDDADIDALLEGLDALVQRSRARHSP